MTPPDLFDAAWQRRHAALIRARRIAQRGYRRQADRVLMHHNTYSVFVRLPAGQGEAGEGRS